MTPPPSPEALIQRLREAGSRANNRELLNAAADALASSQEALRAAERARDEWKARFKEADDYASEAGLTAYRQAKEQEIARFRAEAQRAVVMLYVGYQQQAIGILCGALASSGVETP